MEQLLPKFITKSPPEEASEDFDLLVQQGVELLQKLTGHTWTDYNIHDPGVTILEQLCFAFTDLSYRCGFPMEDILTNEKGEIVKSNNAFFDPGEILCTNPVSINDFRKVLLDEIGEIDNVEITPLVSQFTSHYIKGLYNISIRVNDTVAERFSIEPDLEERIKKKVRDSFLSKRNLGEDLTGDIIVLKPQPITIAAEITVKEFISPEEILLDLYHKIQDYLSPKVRFYSERELRGQGAHSENIYEGPFLKHGFIPDSELKPIVSEIDVMELIKTAASATGVLTVQKLSINGSGEGNSKPFMLEKNSFPWLQATSFTDAINLYAGQYKLLFQKKDFLALYHKSENKNHFQRKVSLHEPYTPSLHRGTYRNLGKYVSIQHNFPHIYGLGERGVHPNESKQRKARVKQLKAYLLFFEQVLANFLAQLASVSEYFSTEIHEGKERSYQYGTLYDIPGISGILNSREDEDAWEKFVSDDHNGYVKSLKEGQENVTIYRKRKHQVYEHLYGRFNKKFVTYPILSYIRTYGEDKSSHTGLLLKWKADVLKNLATIEYNRVKGFNYRAAEKEISGFEKKLRKLLHIEGDGHKRLSQVFESGKVALVSERESQRPGYTGEVKVTPVVWAGETLDVIENADEMIAAGRVGPLLGGGLSQKEAYFFSKEGISILKHGLVRENYRIGPSTRYPGQYVIIYKKPAAAAWRVISRHGDAGSAELALDKLIGFLRKISLGSEGFHLVEHVLLRPLINSDSFGFRFCRKKDTPVFMNASWHDFQGRENVLAAITTGVALNGLTPNEQIKLNPSYKNAFNLAAEVADFRQDSTRFYPRFEMLLKTKDGKILNEDFFNMRITVALPGWPARFQEPEFRNFTEDLFRSCAPVGYHFHFLWLGVNKMREFEVLYFDWLEAMRKNENTQQAAEKLAWFVGADHYRAHPF